MTVLENKCAMNSTNSVFEIGKLKIKTIKVKKSDHSLPPAELYLVSPVEEGRYPVVLFLHSYFTENSWYSQLLQHISSHGYIVVAPQLYPCLLISLNNELKTASKVTNWLSTGLQFSLPKNIKSDLSNLALLGHSMGGKTAFSLALGHIQTSLKFKAILAIDPISRPSPPTWTQSKILSYIPQSFHISIPIGIIGTGLSNQSRGIFPPFSPDGMNHAEFFNESKPPCCYFLAKDYGQFDILDESKAGLARLMCRSGKESKEKMRRGVGGIVVAFLQAYLGDEFGYLEHIVDRPSGSPILLDPVIYIRK